MKYRLSKLADADLDDIWKYIARDNRSAADQVESELHAAIRRLAQMPDIGHRRQGVTNPAYRFWSVRACVIAYRMEKGMILGMRVVDGARNFRTLFK